MVGGEEIHAQEYVYYCIYQFMFIQGQNIQKQTANIGWNDRLSLIKAIVVLCIDQLEMGLELHVALYIKNIF